MLVVQMVMVWQRRQWYQQLPCWCCHLSSSILLFENWHSNELVNRWPNKKSNAVYVEFNSSIVFESTMSAPFILIWATKMIALPWHDAFVYGPLNFYHSNKIKQTMRTQMIERYTDEYIDNVEEMSKHPLWLDLSLSWSILCSLTHAHHHHFLFALKSIEKWKLAVFNRVYNSPNE